MIDAALPLQVQPPQITSALSLLNQRGALQQQQANIADTQQQTQQRGLQNQSDSIKLGQQQQGVQDDQDKRAAIASATKIDPATGQPTVDRPTLLSTLAKLNPTAAVQLQQSLSAQDTATADAKTKLQDAQLAHATAVNTALDKVLQNVHDQPSLTAAMQSAQQLGIDPKQYGFTGVWSPQEAQTVAQAHAQVLSTQQQITNALDAQKEKDAAAKALADQPIATKATNIYAIPPAQRTPEQNAFITGYEKNNDLTKIKPAEVRVQALLSMPQAVVDPNDPSRTQFVTKKNAVGMEAPSSGEAAGARKVITSAIGGKLGDTINSYNTASAHLDMLSQAADALYNGNVRVLNQVGNAFNKETGNPAPTNFQAVKSAVAGEVSKTFKGGQATDAEIKQADDAINSANSPKQLQGVIQTYKDLMASKRNAIQQQVQQGVQGRPNFGQHTAQPSGLGVKLSDAMALPQNEGKSAQEVTADIQAHGHTVIQ